MMRTATRWGDNDKYLGPFTFARDRSYKHLAVMLNSGDHDDELGRCRLRISVGGFTFITALPQIITPYKVKVPAPSWDAATVERMGRDWYWDIYEREYGFSYGEGFLQIKLGRQTHDSSTTQSKGYFLPWTQWRLIRHSMYDLDDNHFWTEPKRIAGEPYDHEDRWKARETCPSASFAFEDFDGEQLSAKTQIEEREWKFGEGWFKWLSIFRRTMIRRSLDIQFSGETGKRKGSWKGGTMGHSIDMKPGELHEAAFRRYCAENSMTFSDRLP